MIKLIKVNKENKGYARQFLSTNLDNVYIIIKDNIKVGVIEYKHLEEGLIKVEYITLENSYRGMGIAQKIVFSLLKDNDICGDCLPISQAIHFWKSCGADFEEDVRECMEEEACIPFTIYRK